MNGAYLLNGGCDMNIGGLGGYTPPESRKHFGLIGYGIFRIWNLIFLFQLSEGSGKFVFSRDHEWVKITSDDMKLTDHPFDDPLPILNNTTRSLHRLYLANAKSIWYYLQISKR